MCLDMGFILYTLFGKLWILLNWGHPCFTKSGEFLVFISSNTYLSSTYFIFLSSGSCCTDLTLSILYIPKIKKKIPTISPFLISSEKIIQSGHSDH